MMWTPSPARDCRECREALPARHQGRGRPPEYCSRACRQAAYRRRQRRTRNVPPRPNPRPDVTGPDPSHHEQQLLQLALDAQEESRHLVRLLAPGQDDVRAAIACVARLQQHVEVLTAGTVVRARQRRTPWDAVARLLNMSAETARRTFHEDAVRRQLNRLAPPGPAHPPAQRSPRPSSENPAPPTSTGSPTTTESPSTAAAPPVRHRATSQLAPVLSRLHRATGLPLRQLGLQVRVSASYLSRVLSGERFPSWELTERLAHALGADTLTLRRIWEDEERRITATRVTSPPCPRHTPTSGEMRPCLHSALRTLHRRAGGPSPRAIAIVTGPTLTEQQITDVLSGSYVPDWPQTERLIHVLDGEPAFFQPLWEAAAHQPATLPLNRPADTPSSRLDALFTAFSGTLSSPPPALAR